MSTPPPDFSRIQFVYSGKPINPSESTQKIDLFRFFNAIINNEKLQVNQFHLEQIFSQDLKINVRNIDKSLMNVLGEALVHYMARWPGWQNKEKYQKGQLECRTWFERFQQYLVIKSNIITKNSGRIIAYLGGAKNAAASKEVGIQTEDEKVAPYTVIIGGLPHVLNNIYFDKSGEDIVVKHQIEKPWENLKLKEFLNWPYVAVELKLRDIAFKRINTHKYERYITLSSDDPVVFPEADHITHVIKASNVAEYQLTPYSYKFIACYLQQLYRTLKQIPEINLDRLQELKAAFIEFLADIQEANLYNCTMCTYTSVGYNIGKSKYIRKNNKTLSSTAEIQTPEEDIINFHEIITPQVDFSLQYFDALQDTEDIHSVSFKSLNALASATQEDLKLLRYYINGCIMYSCTLCRTNFHGKSAYYDVTKHFYEVHKAERAVDCAKCHQQFEVKLLAEQRWAHTCT